ncbi:MULTISPECIES: Fic family protein [unclassified Bradyrhizobium]
MGTHIPSPSRSLLENLKPSREREGPRRNVGRKGVELELERLLKIEHEEGLRAIRRRAHNIVGALGAADELKVLDDLIGTFLKTRETKFVHGKVAARHRRDSPFDPECMERLKALALVLNRSPLPDRPDPHAAPDERACASFVEAYFTNFIEGTRFSVDKARRIVFENEEPDGRPADGRDIVQTFKQVSAMVKGMQMASSYVQFEEEIRERNRILLDGRPEKDPGNFKTEPNSAGNTQFVLPDLVVGTLKQAYETLGSLTHPLARGIFVHTMLVLVHPFNDGNGRTSRIMMTKELVSAGQCRIVVPSVFQDDYINGIKSLAAAPNFSPAPLVRALLEAQRITNAIASPDLDRTIDLWASTHAFVDDDERDAKLTFPNADLKIERRNGIPAPSTYWEAVDLRNSLGGGDISMLVVHSRCRRQRSSMKRDRESQAEKLELLKRELEPGLRQVERGEFSEHGVMEIAQSMLEEGQNGARQSAPGKSQNPNYGLRNSSMVRVSSCTISNLLEISIDDEPGRAHAFGHENR